ncbi:DUF7544 domain-containing protein [Natrinema gari]|uniref:Transmembrane protein n=1 Tax=Natrinema gari JCM 14663 TaxID=1230459 RepID=L9YSK7_9EURY|nr:hypothetical protein [Natrinema gari]ELY77094.1 hypothetical protein C486_16625 [Natrinema gari JCM 14663]
MDAIDDLGDAIDVTRTRLTPFRTGTWLRLALIVFFVSSLGLGGPTIPGGDTGTVTDDPMVEEQSQEFGGIAGEELLFWALVIVAIVVVLWLLYEFISAVMEFVFLESLRSSEVHVRRYFSANLGKGLWLFLFRFGLRVLLAVVAIAPAAVFLLSMEADLDGLSMGVLLLYLVYAIVLGLLYAITMRFTTEFVAPIMLLTDRGVRDGWGQFWSTMTANWSDYVVYLLLVWILQFVIGTAATIIIGLSGLVLAIPFVIVGVLLVIAFDTAGLVLAILLGVVGLVLLLLLASLLYVPVETYFRYYALLLLGDTDADLDLIPDRRGAVRGGGPVDGGDRGGNGPAGFGGTDPGSDRLSDRDDTAGWDDPSGRNDDRDDTSGWDSPSGWDDDTDETDGWNDDPDDTESREGWSDDSDEDDEDGW